MLQLRKVLLKPVFHKGYQVFGSGFFEDVFPVRFHGAHADFQLLPNLFASVFVEDEVENLRFARG